MNVIHIYVVFLILGMFLGVEFSLISGCIAFLHFVYNRNHLKSAACLALIYVCITLYCEHVSIPTGQFKKVEGKVVHRVGGRGALFSTSKGRFYLANSAHLIGCHIESKGRSYKPKRPENPGGFDQKRWLRRYGIHSIWQQSEINVLSCQFSWSSWFYKRITRSLDQSNLRHRDVIESIILGRASLYDDFWAYLGLIQMISVSGFHFRSLYYYIYRQSLYGRLKKYKGSFSIAIMFLYMRMLGEYFTIVQEWLKRTAQILNRRYSLNYRQADIFFFIQAIILTHDPYAVFATGWWVSITVSVVIQCTRRHKTSVPHVLWFVLLCVSIIEQDVFTPTSIVANYIAYPFIQLYILPLCVICVISAILGFKNIDYILNCIDGGVELVSQAMISLINLQCIEFLFTVDRLLSIIALVILWYIFKAPRYIALLLLISWPSSQVPEGLFDLHVLSVGHGLSVVIRTNRHILLYDVGSQRRGVAKNVVIPFLQNQGIRSIDHIVISHADADHMNGLSDILKRYSVGRLWVSTKLIVNKRQLLCQRGAYWIWDGVRFEFIHPDQGKVGVGNNHSCVLKISGQRGSVLLTGDIEKKAEQELLEQGLSLNLDVLVAPHHGSATSSTPDFLKAVQPKKIVVSERSYRLPERWHNDEKVVLPYYYQRL